MHNRHIGEQRGPVFEQKLQGRSAPSYHQVGRPLPIPLPQKIPFTLLLPLAGKSGHVEEFAVKLDAVAAFGREGRPDGLIRDDVGGQQSLVRVEHKDTSQRLCRRSLSNHSAACPRHDQEHSGAEPEKSCNPNR